MIQQVERTFDLLYELKKNYPNKADMLCCRKQEGWVKFSVNEYFDNSHFIAYALLARGYKKGDKVISITPNCPEWNFIDMGLNLAGMVHIPVYPTLSDEEYLHIISHSDATIIFVGTKKIHSHIQEICLNIDRDILLIPMYYTDNQEDIQNLLSLGQEKELEFKELVKHISESIDTEDMATIIYTSGTTGLPKGVMLSHKNLMFNAYGHAVKQTVTNKQKMLSFLPLCHIYERTMNYEYQYLGISIYYAESLSTIARDLADSHADGFCSVPRVIEMMYGKLEAAGKNQFGIKKKIYDWAFKFANNFDNYNESKLYKLKLNIADRLVYSKWRQKLGGKEMLIVSGGSSIQPKMVRLFNAAKLRIFEGYGMTEASPVIAVNSPMQGFNVIGTVGKAMEGTELSFAEDGEILTRGPHVMLGYYKDPEYSREVIDEQGWLHTGDIGELIDGQYLKITDRKKEIFKLSSGKYIAPQVIETLLKESPYIQQCIVIGENQKFASAIIHPDLERLHFWAAKHKISYKDNLELITNPKLIAKIHREVDKVNLKLNPHENIKRERLVMEEWTISNSMLSQTLKLKRKNILERYKVIINEIYNNL